MASSSTTKYIIIDWSSPPTNSFIQLGKTQLPQKDSYNYVQDFEQEVVLTTKDILHLDIDDILSPSFYIAPPPRRKNFPFLVSFKKIHVTKTQYTVIPYRIQKKYFNMLRKTLLERIMFIELRANKTDDRNHQMKTFFNFSYKRYRFHFGIYVPCEHQNVQNNSSPPTPCQLPSAIILSNNRHSCGSHVKKIFQDITLKKNQSPSIQENNTKAFHANIIFKRWQNIEWKDPNIKVAKRQQRRFERNCRRVLKKEVIKPGGTSNAASKLGAAKTSNFLFLPSHTINKRLSHLRFQDIKTYPEHSGLNFSTLYDHRYKKKLTPVERPAISKAVTIEPQVIAPPTMTNAERPIISEVVIIEPQVIAHPR
ncbi:hypothetical protein C1646_770585 [Rhizophagus diaphanus]|nr:hypothetical protein C1646_770585 [Rhizophagus diaphanus] [Rhizophagus sp. MUCL 43196]